MDRVKIISEGGELDISREEARKLYEVLEKEFGVKSPSLILRDMGTPWGIPSYPAMPWGGTPPPTFGSPGTGGWPTYYAVPPVQPYGNPFLTIGPGFWSPLPSYGGGTTTGYSFNTNSPVAPRVGYLTRADFQLDMYGNMTVNAAIQYQ